MRILALTNLYPNPLQPYRGTFNRQQLRALAERHEVRVISPIAWTDEWSAVRDCAAARMPADRRIHCDGLSVAHPRYVFPPKVFRGLYGHFFRHSIRPAFGRALDEFQPDLVLAAWAYPDGWAAVELGHQAGLPVVVKVHGSDILTLARTRGRGRRTAEAVRRADAVIAVSRDLAEKVVSMGAAADRVSVVYDGIDVVRFRPGDKKDSRRRLDIGSEPMILFVGNLVPVKGVDVLIQSCAHLAQRGRRFQCFLVGQGPLKETLQAQISCTGLGGQVTLTGPIAHAALPEWFRAADVFVLPSHSEGVPCVLLEAAGCRTPYVATRVGGVPEIAHLNDGRLVPAGDADALADALEEQLWSPLPKQPPVADFRRSHGDAAREIEAVCQRVLARSTRRLTRRAS